MLAGCAGVNPLAGGGTDGDAAPALEDAPPAYEPPLGDTALRSDHLAALREAGTFTLELNSTVSDSQEASYAYRSLVRARLGDGAVYTTRRPAPVTQIYQFGNGTSFVRINGDDNVQYDRDPGVTTNAAEWARRPAVYALRLFEYRHAGVTTRDGERVHVYRASGAESLNKSALRFAYGEQVTAYAGNATLHVRENGLVTFVDIAYQVGTEERKRTVTWTARVSELGATDVSPPAWLSAAREQTGNASE